MDAESLVAQGGAQQSLLQQRVQVYGRRLSRDLQLELHVRQLVPEIAPDHINTYWSSVWRRSGRSCPSRIRLGP